MKAIIIGSDPVTVNFATQALRLRWPDVIPTVVPDATSGTVLIEKLSPQVVLLHALDVGMELSSVVQEVRRITMAPLLVLGCHGKEIETVTALTLGADDYVKLPSTITELTMRVWARLRRTALVTAGPDEAPLRSGPLLVNIASREVYLGDQVLHLTSTEFRLLGKLMEGKGSVITYRMLDCTIGDQVANGRALVKKYIQRLRSKLGDNARAPRWIACIHGIGYRFVGPTPTNGLTPMADCYQRERILAAGNRDSSTSRVTPEESLLAETASGAGRLGVSAPVLAAGGTTGRSPWR